MNKEYDINYITSKYVGELHTQYQTLMKVLSLDLKGTGIDVRKDTLNDYRTDTSIDVIVISPDNSSQIKGISLIREKPDNQKEKTFNLTFEGKGFAINNIDLSIEGNRCIINKNPH